jgi:hypothetical protein
VQPPGLYDGFIEPAGCQMNRLGITLGRLADGGGGTGPSDHKEGGPLAAVMTRYLDPGRPGVVVGFDLDIGPCHAGVALGRHRGRMLRSDTWLILPVVICLSQSLSHASL